MAETGVMHTELPNFITILAETFKGNIVFKFLLSWQTTAFSLIVVSILSAFAYYASRNISLIPGRLQGVVEVYVGGVDDFTRGILGPKGRKFTPFIGTLFIYILCMNLSGIVPFMKSSTASWSTTLALALSVFFYLQFTAIKELGLSGYFYHLLGKPKGIIALSVIIPLMMLIMEIIAALVRPISLSLRLRSNIWGEDMLLTMLAGFGIPFTPLLLFNAVLGIITAIVQAGVFCLLTTIYFALVLTHEE